MRDPLTAAGMKNPTAPGPSEPAELLPAGLGFTLGLQQEFPCSPEQCWLSLLPPAPCNAQLSPEFCLAAGVIWGFSLQPGRFEPLLICVTSVPCAG